MVWSTAAPGNSDKSVTIESRLSMITTVKALSHFWTRTAAVRGTLWHAGRCALRTGRPSQSNRQMYRHCMRLRDCCHLNESLVVKRSSKTAYSLGTAALVENVDFRCVQPGNHPTLYAVIVTKCSSSLCWLIGEDLERFMCTTTLHFLVSPAN